MTGAAWLRLCGALACWASAAGAVANVRCPPAAGARCRAPPAARYGERNFYVDDKPIVYDYQEGAYFGVRCPEGVALDDPALPRFEPALLVDKATVACEPGAGGFRAALDALGVRALGKLAVRGPAGATVTRAALAGFEALPRLELEAVRLERGALLALADLRALRLEDVPLAPGEAEELPTSLRALTLIRTGPTEPSAAALARLPRLETLMTRAAPAAPLALDASAAPALRSLAATAAGALAPELPAALANLTLNLWAVAEAPAWAACAGLERLELRRPGLRALPPRWLARCGRLRSLRVEDARALSSVAPDALAGAPLEELALRGSSLAALPADLLLGAAALLRLDVSGNALAELPSFAGCAALVALDASGNALRSDALHAAGGVPGLRELRLAGNARLDACPAAGALGGAAALAGSPLFALGALRALDLSRTATRRVCADWRTFMPRLSELALRGTNLTALTLEDLKFAGDANVTVDAREATLGELAFAARDEEAARRAGGPRVTLCLSRAPRCDCRGYWAARALRASPRLRLAGPECGDDSPPCADGRPWAAVPPEAMACPVAAPACPARCACSATPAGALRVDCAGANLERVPRVAPLPLPPPLPRLVPGALELLLAGNRIDRLRAEDVSDSVTVLDLRNNSLRVVEEGAAAALLRRPRRTLVGGNALRCACEDTRALAALGAPGALADLRDAACLGGASLAAAAAALPAECASPGLGLGLGPALPAALGALALVACAAAAAALLLRPEARRRLKRLLGKAEAEADPEQADASLPYDFFVSYAHEDEAAARELVARLEAGESALRACEHQRDWAPGGWIPLQIAASVRSSRCTLLLLSRAWLRSQWARAEFREAHAHAYARARSGEARSRLLLVFLEEPSTLELDRELRAHAAACTYAVWGEPHFWSKLRKALPPPRPPAPAPAAAPAPAPPA